MCGMTGPKQRRREYDERHEIENVSMRAMVRA